MKEAPALSANDPLLRDIVELLRKLLHSFLMASMPAWLDLQLTLPQLRTVFIVAHSGSSSVVQIAANLGVGEPTASHLVDKLVQAGLVNRSEDPRDRRRAIVRLSPAGEQLIEKLLGWEELLGEWLHRAPEKDLSLVRQGLGSLVNQIGSRTTGRRKTSQD